VVVFLAVFLFVLPGLRPLLAAGLTSSVLFAAGTSSVVTVSFTSSFFVSSFFVAALTSASVFYG
jgi:hypothetical protein